MVFSLNLLILEFGARNPESDDELDIRARNYILNRICNQYRRTKDPTFTFDKVKAQLKGLDSGNVDLNISENWTGSGLVDIDENYNFTLNKEGIKACENGEFD
jgi:hypothetical protein